MNKWLEDRHLGQACYSLQNNEYQSNMWQAANSVILKVFFDNRRAHHRPTSRHSTGWIQTGAAAAEL